MNYRIEYWKNGLFTQERAEDEATARNTAQSLSRGLATDVWVIWDKDIETANVVGRYRDGKRIK